MLTHEDGSPAPCQRRIEQLINLTTKVLRLTIYVMKTPSSPPSASLETSMPPVGSNHLLDYMKANGLPLTRETYLDLNFPEGVPDPMPAELEMEIPKMFRRVK